MWIIKGIYPRGSHIVMFNGERLRFASKQEAQFRCEALIAASKNWDGTYIVVEETD
jgi:hypothetical protein